jgi:hypothetical protein
MRLAAHSKITCAEQELGQGPEMTEAVVNLISLGLAFLAVILCLFLPIVAIGFILWNWHRESIGLSGSRKVAPGRTVTRETNCVLWASRSHV